MPPTTLNSTLTSTGHIYANSGIVNINAAEWSSGGTKGIFFRSGYTDYNCSILTYDHLGDGFCDGLSINGWDGISFCTGANTRQERMIIKQNGYVGIGGNTNYPLTVNGTANNTLLDQGLLMVVMAHIMQMCRQHLQGLFILQLI